MSLADEWTWNSMVVTWDDLFVSWNGMAAVRPPDTTEGKAAYFTAYPRPR